MDRVKFRQFIIITFLLAVAMKMFMLPTYMLRISGQESFMLMVIESVIDLLLLTVVIFIMRSGKGSLFETVEFAFGKVLGRIITAFLSLFYIVKLFLMLSELKAFFSISVLYIPISPLHIAPLFLLLIFASGKPLSVLGRTGEIIAPLVIASMFLIGALSLSSVNFSNLLPLVTDPANLQRGIMSFPMWFGDFTLLLIYTGKTENRRRLFFSLIPAAAGMAVMILFASMMFALYVNVPQVLTYGHNISNMTQYSVSSFQFGRFDLLVFCIWLLGVLLSSSVMLMFISRSMNYTVGKNVGIYASIVCCIIITVGMYLFSNTLLVCEFMNEYFAIPAMAVQYGFPLTLLVALIIRNCLARRKLKKEGTSHEKARA